MAQDKDVRGATPTSAEERARDPGRHAAGASQSPLSALPPAVLQRKLARRRAQRHADGGNGVKAGAEKAVSGAGGQTGAPLPATLLTKFEGSLGTDLSGVRVHTSAASAKAAEAVSAHAYTTGQDVHFAAGRYAPSTPAGENLLAHEVAHTVQQGPGGGGPQYKLEVSDPGDAAEGEADRAAEAMTAGRPAQVTAAAGVQRKVQRRHEGAAGNDSAAPATADEAGLAQQAFQGKPEPLPFRDVLEKAFGADFSGVTFYRDEAAHKALAHMNAEGVTVGPKIAVINPSLHLIAHEAAHVVQQGAVRVRPEHRGRANVEKASDHEAEADRAAAAVLAGRPAHVTLEAGTGPQLWGGSDHHAIGELGGQKAIGLAGGDAVLQKIGVGEVQANDLKQPGQGPGGIANGGGQTIGVNTVDGSQVTFGEANRQSGDYTQTPDGSSLNRDAGALPNGGIRANGWKQGGMIQDWHNNSMYLAAATNSNHFYPLNHTEYQSHHDIALQKAAASRTQSPDDAKKTIDDALREEGFACHFLQDCFASGHQAPRSLDSTDHLHEPSTARRLLSGVLYAAGAIPLSVFSIASEALSPDNRAGNAAASSNPLLEDGVKGLQRTKQWHDYFCMLPNGLPTTLGRFHGDYNMDGNDLAKVSDATAQSLGAVLTTAATGQDACGRPELPTPDFGAIMADPVAGPAWKLMMKDYQSDLQKAEAATKNIDRNGGTTDKTDGGSAYNAGKVFDDIEKNVFGGQGLDGKPIDTTWKPAAAAAPAGTGAAVTSARNDMLNVAMGLKTYLTQDFLENIHTGEDDTGNQAHDDTPHEDFTDLEPKYGIISSLQKSAQQYVQAVSDACKANPPGTTSAELDFANQVKSWADDLRARYDAACSWWVAGAGRNTYARVFAAECDQKTEELRGFKAAPPPIAQRPPEEMLAGDGKTSPTAKMA